MSGLPKTAKTACSEDLPSCVTEGSCENASMFLRAIKRHKDGKLHLYWTLVENVRAGRRVFQRQALYLGELNDSQRAEWQRAIEAFEEKGRARQLKL